MKLVNCCSVFCFPAFVQQLPLLERDSALAHDEACEGLNAKLGEEVLMVAAVSGTIYLIMCGFAPIIVDHGHSYSRPVQEARGYFYI